ncbi:conserved Plasmodium protein, unknown function [Plasmodium knowlesi strain H]|uniref:Uncharacterized protein n=3 Tax=Plasmodium knowlesi TaxID=5850 RepID=A0A1A7W072_PLAKH|nr:conserved Plasmodium protein, unknown function [Plasmodium knowlesi strain H]OTN64410.1 Uncharacterized protein PKNOH_S130191900 [Plasmodium knowlesi]CAA9989082.1 conserved Plasmodium protein, unknown function [Plasmodium knowlesi strain H]SBO27296.1 conserved Plasmodium protein, unknown function [Plasmodium knowlesi strain H]SBO28922.1 conserved Plasmodium protein, unknown function [Plasmodium knowlesi strain H]VVS78556.1 conserved Plasmodium protein, unknown function [Plasmodium knowlesi 
MMLTMEMFVFLLAIALMLYLYPGDYMSSSDTIGAFEPLSSTSRFSNSENSRRKSHTHTFLSFPSKHVIIENYSTSSSGVVLPEEQPLSTGAYTSADVHEEEPRATTSSHYDRFFKKKTKKSKELINNYLDSILDRDVLTYYEQDAGSIHSQDMNVENFSDELCIQTYVMSTHLMVHGDEFQRENAYMNVCRDCHQFFENTKECLDNSINMSIKNDSEEETVIKVPLLGLKYEKSGKANQSLVVNFPVTYILSRLTSSLVDMDSYDSKNLSSTCDILRKKLEGQINKKLSMLPNEMSIFWDYISSYRDNFQDEMRIKVTNMSKPINSCEELLKSLKNMNSLTYSLVNKSGRKYLGNQKNKKRMESFVFSIFNFKHRESNTNVQIKSIYDFSYAIFDIIGRIKKIYNEEMRFFFLKDLETPELFFLRNNLNIKNMCSINIIATISWFFNQVNMGIYNKNKTVLELFTEKFSSENIEKIVKMKNIKKNVPKKYIMDLCFKTMTEMVDMVRSTLLSYHEESLSKHDEEIHEKEEEPDESSDGETVRAPSPTFSLYEDTPRTPSSSNSPYEDTPRTPSPSNSPYEDTPRTPSPSNSPYEDTPRTPSPSNSPYEDTPRTPSPSNSPYEDTPRTPSPTFSPHGNDPQTSTHIPMSYLPASLPFPVGYVPHAFSSTSSLSTSPPPHRNGVNKKFTFSNIIKYAEMSLLKQKLSELLNDTSEHARSYESHEDTQRLQMNTWARENFICLMKFFSSKMNSQLSGLQNSFLQKLTLENYKLYTIINKPIDDRDHMYFCTIPGEYLIYKIVSSKFFFMINIYK